jgi:hypothetical protein
MPSTNSAKADGISGGNFNLTDPVTLLKRNLPSNQWNDADAVARFFLSILYPAEGRANLDSYRAQTVDFLNTGDNGAPSAFNTLGNTTGAYDTRVRAAVSMLMTLPRFQEQ